MLAELKFVKGSVAKKDFDGALTHFCIEKGTVRGYNGKIALCTPISLDMEAKPKAEAFIMAIESCTDTIAIHRTPTGRLSIKSGAFKALVDCMDEPFPDVQPEGEELQTGGGLLKCFQTLAPFIAEDASREWARGIMLRGSSAFVTNNVVLIEYWLGQPFPKEVNVPQMAIKELLRIGEEPEKLQIAEGSITFHFSGGRWLRSQLYGTNWPDLQPVLNQPGQPVQPHERFWEGVATLAPFADKLGRLYLAPGKLATSTSEEDGASFELPGFNYNGCYAYKHLRDLADVVDLIDFSQYPRPCPFTGKDKMLRGVVIGMRG